MVDWESGKVIVLHNSERSLGNIGTIRKMESDSKPTPLNGAKAGNFANNSRAVCFVSYVQQFSVDETTTKANSETNSTVPNVENSCKNGDHDKG